MEANKKKKEMEEAQRRKYDLEEEERIRKEREHIVRQAEAEEKGKKQ
jgi:hypothetical protein